MARTRRITERLVQELRTGVNQSTEHLVDYLALLVQSRKVRVRYFLQAWTFRWHGLDFDVEWLQDGRPRLRIYRASDPGRTERIENGRRVVTLGTTPIFEFQETHPVVLQPLIDALHARTREFRAPRRELAGAGLRQEYTKLSAQVAGLHEILKAFGPLKEDE